jgi:hypothetical protein
MRGVRVSIEVIDINEQMTCLLLVKSHQSEEDDPKIKNPLTLRVDFGGNLAPLPSLRH